MEYLARLITENLIARAKVQADLERARLDLERSRMEAEDLRGLAFAPSGQTYRSIAENPPVDPLRILIEMELERYDRRQAEAANAREGQ